MMLPLSVYEIGSKFRMFEIDKQYQVLMRTGDVYLHIIWKNNLGVSSKLEISLIL